MESQDLFKKIVEMVQRIEMNKSLDDVIKAFKTFSELRHNDDDEDDCLACELADLLNDIPSPFLEYASLSKDNKEKFFSVVGSDTKEAVRVIRSIVAEYLNTNPGHEPGKICEQCNVAHQSALEWIEEVYDYYHDHAGDGIDGPASSNYPKEQAEPGVWDVIPSNEPRKFSEPPTFNPPKPPTFNPPTLRFDEKTFNLKKENNNMTMASSDSSSPKNNSNTKFKNVGVVFSGEQIVLPEGMTFDEATTWIARMKEENQKIVAINEVVDCHPLEGAYAFKQVLDEKFGFTNMVNTPGFFRDNPPIMLGFEIGYKKTTQVPWGRVTIPAFGDADKTSGRSFTPHLNTGIDVKGADVVFKITGEVRQSHKGLVSELANLVRDRVRTHSIYRGSAIYLRFHDPEDFNINDSPTFMDAGTFDEQSIVFSKETQDLIDVSIMTPMKKTQLCRDLKIPLKRGILLEGPYGTGKTLTANMSAKVAVENGWTFLYLQDPAKLADAIRFAQKYEPACIFLEDVDRVFNGERDDDMNEVLNVMDGIDTKSSEIMIVLTTNHIEQINPAALRPGRLDAIISVRAPDTEAVGRLIKLYSRGKLASGADITAVCRKLAKAETIPAAIREVVERSKLGAIARSASGEELQITEKDLMIASNTMPDLKTLLDNSKGDKRHAMEKFGEAMGAQVALAIKTYDTHNNGKYPTPIEKTNGHTDTA